VAFALGRELLHPYHVPPVPVPPVEVALALGVPILPVAVSGVEPARRWVVRVGAPIVTRRRAATGDPAELAEATRTRLQRLLTDARRS